MPSSFPRGSEWRRWDLHFHTPSSYDYQDSATTNQQLIDGLLATGIRVVAITDHHTIDVARIRELQLLAGPRLTVLPGIELRSDQGGKPIHYICIFPEDCDLDHVWTTLQGKLGLTSAAIASKGGDEKVYVPLENGAAAARELGGVVSIHAGEKTNSIESILNREQFQQRIKYDLTRQWVDLMEIGQIKDIDVHYRKIFPSTGLEKPLIICSDNHAIKDYKPKCCLWFRADPTFRGLLMVIREPRDRVHIGEKPEQLVRVEQNPTKYIKSISFSRAATAPVGEYWFQGQVEFNSGLVAVVGNKGSGKSALGDTLGLLGATRNAPYFPFLSKERFRHPVSGRAAHFSATLNWHAGDPVTRTLADVVKTEEVERVKYLPQDHVERICNELVGSGEEGFERELRGVIFSHVPEAETLGVSNLDDLIRLRTGEKQKRIDSLLKQLREESRGRALLEAQADPVVEKEIDEKIKKRELELRAHESTKPVEVPNPSTLGAAPVDPELLSSLAAVQHQRDEILAAIAATTERQKSALRRDAAATRLTEKLANFKKDFDAFQKTLDPEAKELGLKPTDLISLTVVLDPVEKIRAKSVAEGTGAKLALEGPDGLRERLKESEAKLADLQATLDAPNRAYQAFLKSQSDWEAKKKELEGTAATPESLAGLKAAKTALRELPRKIEEARDRQIGLALAIRSEKVAQVDVYRSFYAPVQSFIDSHALAKERLQLEFRAELVNEDFAGRLLALLAQNRRGSFMGLDDGRARAQQLAEPIEWENETAVRQFLLDCDAALHRDMRPGQNESVVQLKDQLPKGKRVEEVFDMLFGLEYLRPRYVLRWEGKDLSVLSPGERGTLLLVFYLLIDKEDIPLVIDQPEGNLDNFTVAKILVECIKETRKRRQVFIVTHNPNLAVVCDADQVVHASMDKKNGNRITYVSGSLEDPATSEFVTDVLEGTRWAFAVRDGKYKVGETRDPGQ